MTFWHLKSLSGWGEIFCPHLRGLANFNPSRAHLLHLARVPQEEIFLCLNHLSTRDQTTKHDPCSLGSAEVVHTSQSCTVYPALPCLFHGNSNTDCGLSSPSASSASWPTSSAFASPCGPGWFSRTYEYNTLFSWAPPLSPRVATPDWPSRKRTQSTAFVAWKCSLSSRCASISCRNNIPTCTCLTC